LVFIERYENTNEVVGGSSFTLGGGTSLARSPIDHIDGVLSYALDALALRQQVTANNMANVNTPGFKRGTVSFESHLQEALAKPSRVALARTHAKHLPSGSPVTLKKPSVVIDRHTSLRNDGNNVDIERESAQMTKDTLQYQAIIEQVNRRMGTLRSVIHDGRR